MNPEVGAYLSRGHQIWPVACHIGQRSVVDHLQSDVGLITCVTVALL